MHNNIRLNKIASFVRKDAILVDIGCDHGYLAISLVKNNKISYAYASDINEGPLENVKKNVAKEKLENKIECRLSDGLIGFQNTDFSDVVIAGMGGSLIVEILSENIQLIQNKRLVLQPNINAEGLRKWLVSNNFMIIADDLVKENDIIYQIIIVEGSAKQNFSSLELTFGKGNLANKSELLVELMYQRINKNKSILASMPKNNEKYYNFKEMNELMEGYLNEIRKNN